jgi:hypothetical protein
MRRINGALGAMEALKSPTGPVPARLAAGVYHLVRNSVVRLDWSVCSVRIL